jgi:hypothetical protein
MFANVCTSCSRTAAYVFDMHGCDRGEERGVRAEPTVMSPNLLRWEKRRAPGPGQGGGGAGGEGFFLFRNCCVVLCCVVWCGVVWCGVVFFLCCVVLCCATGNALFSKR